MTSYGGNTTGASFYGCRVFIRDDDGAPAVPAGTAVGTSWPGVKVHKARALTITPAEPMRLQARGDGRTYATFIEPPTETPSGELRAQTSDIDLIELMTSVKDYGSGYRHMVPLASDQVGQEEQVWIFGWRKAKDSDPTSTSYLQDMWETRVILNANASYQPDPMETDQLSEPRWTLVANSSTKDQYGRTMTTAIHGCTEASFVSITSQYKLTFDVFIGDNSETEFTLNKGAATIYNDANNPVRAFVDGVSATVSTSAAGVVTFSPAPGTGSKIVIESGYAD
jgi:hypothetical protein